MKKHLFSALFSLLLTGLLVAGSGFTAQATIWRIDNNAGSPGTFTTAAAAFAAGSGVAAGDSLYFNGSGTNYGSATVDRRVYIFGPGYFLAQNPETQASPVAATVGTLTFTSASNGSAITGMSFFNLTINASNILVKRNYGTRTGGATSIIEVGASQANVLIVQNYLYHNDGGRAIRVLAGCSNVLIANNFLGNNYAPNDANYAAIWASAPVTITQNHVYSGYVFADNSAITNNIFRSSGITGGGNGIQNNMADNGMFGATNGNQPSITLSNVFVNTGSDDGYYQLKPNTTSPAYTNLARGAGANGEDLGMFGGIDPYVLSGMPAIPAIWFMAAPSSGSSSIQVRIKAKSHN